MLHFWMICLFAVLFLAEAMEAPGAAMLLGEPWWRENVPLWLVIVTHLAAMGALAAVDVALILREGRLLDMTGRHRHIRRAHIFAELAQAAAVVVHIVGVLAFGWLHAIRAGLERLFGAGNPVLVDELLAIAPAVGVFICSWWALYGIDRRCREGALIGALDDGLHPRPIALPTRGQFVLSHIRHQMLMTLAPMALIIGWAECADWLIATGQKGTLGQAVANLLEPAGRREWIRAAVHFTGVAAILFCAPILLRLIWDTAPLPRGPLRDRLEEICAEAKVRIRNILIWRTHGSMINGAVVGFVPRLRYILLTDALLDSLTRPQVEAVMAHEVAHARHRHMPWLAAVLITAVAAAGFLASLLLSGLAMVPSIGRWLERTAERGGDGPSAAQAGIEAAMGAISLIAGLIIFGWASRRFEWQADAFAVQVLSRAPAGGDAAGAGGIDGAVAGDAALAEGTYATGRSQGPSPAMTPAAVGAMAGALGAVAAINGIPRRKRSWRHGSIATRQARIRALLGVPIAATPIDRTVRRIKAAAAAGVVVVVALLIWLG